MSARGFSSDGWWAGSRSPLGESLSLEPEAFVGDDFFRAEQQQVFERAWVCIGLAGDVASPGPTLVRQVGSVSVIITRSGDGELRGFVNSCRHRGTELLAQDCELANTIRCPYHRWGYSMTGQLVATPLFDEVPRTEFDHDDYSLVSVRVDTWGVLLFVCLDEATPSLEEWLGDLPQRMASYRLDEWATDGARIDQGEVEIAANWKLITENFQEYYHLGWVHPELAKVSRVKDHYRYQGPGMYCGQTTTPVSGDERGDWLALPPAAGLDESDQVSGRFVAIFPNVMLSVLPNHIWVMRLDPVAPGHTNEVWTMLVPPSTTPLDSPAAVDAAKSTVDFWLEVNNEDIDIVERGQRGLTNIGTAAAVEVPPGPLSPRFEEPLHRFQNMLADCITLDTLATLVVPDGDRPGNKEDRRGTAPNPSPPAIEQH